MSFITVDLGTTNIKVTAFTDDLREAASTSVKVIYASQGKWIEFDPEAYFSGILNSIGRMVPQLREPVRQIVLTGQAESLVLLDNKARVLRAGISWLDTRSDQECDRIKLAFPEDAAFLVTGQPANTPTWPITKILWLKEHEPDIFGQVDKFVLLKDYIQYRLSGILLGEYSIYNFSYYFDIRKKDYWQDLLDWCGIRRSQLPDLVEPCTTVGLISAAIARETLSGERQGAVRDIVLDGTVSEVNFLGSVIRLRVALGGNSVQLDTFNDQRRPPPAFNQKVQVGIAASDVLVLEA